MQQHSISRRDCLKTLSASVWAGVAANSALGMAEDRKPAEPIPPKKVAAVITAYAKGLHADVVLGKILEGWKQDKGPGPALQLVSMYVDQFPEGDLARPMAAKYNVPIFDTIEQAVTVGGDEIPVDGVISIGEHGEYPWNAKEQHLYPRRRFFEEITDTFKKYKKVVPVFNDKHLGPVWADAIAMYERAQEMRVPFMAGSSLPLSFREPDISVPMNCEIESIVAIGYSGLDIYGAHALECFQAFAERRRGAESGVQWVQCLEGDAVWKAIDDGVVAKETLDAVLAVTPTRKDIKLRDEKAAALFLFQYTDGLMGTVLMLPEYSQSISTSIKLKGSKPIACRYTEPVEPRHPHFAYLLKGVERMFHTGKPSYPVERTLLTSGILDRALTSRVQGHRKIMTPELAIRYEPVDYPHAPKPKLLSDPRA